MPALRRTHSNAHGTAQERTSLGDGGERIYGIPWVGVGVIVVLLIHCPLSILRLQSGHFLGADGGGGVKREVRWESGWVETRREVGLGEIGK